MVDLLYVNGSWNMFSFLNLNLPGTPNTSKRVLHGVRAQMAVPKTGPKTPKQKFMSFN